MRHVNTLGEVSDTGVIARPCVPTIRRAHIALPRAILDDPILADAIKYSLPSNYNFEVEKSLARIKQEDAKHVALQFPEGLLVFSSAIAAILKYFGNLEEVTILGDVTYGACCIDDLTARAIGADLLIHYGHSCLVPIDQTSVPLSGKKCSDSEDCCEKKPLRCLYVFVDIVFDFQALIGALKSNFPPRETGLPLRFALMGTVQYSAVVHSARQMLEDLYGLGNVVIPRENPLTAGEVIGCTSPKIVKYDSVPSRDGSKGPIEFVIFISDGRFHLESAMIQNPELQFYRFDPFHQKVFKESYDHSSLLKNRREAVLKARSAKHVGLILGTLGRQGSVGIFERLQNVIRSYGAETSLFLMSEVMPHRIAALRNSSAVENDSVPKKNEGLPIDAFVQVACPRLSIDWGHCFADATPVLTPFEAMVAFDPKRFNERLFPGGNDVSAMLDSNNVVYPMDYYSKNGGEWTNYAQTSRTGSLAKSFGFEGNSLDDLDRRRALIRERARKRREAQQM